MYTERVRKAKHSIARDQGKGKESTAKEAPSTVEHCRLKNIERANSCAGATDDASKEREIAPLNTVPCKLSVSMGMTNPSSSKATTSEVGATKGNSATILKWNSILQKGNAGDGVGGERERALVEGVGTEKPGTQPNQHQRVACLEQPTGETSHLIQLLHLCM